MKIPRLLVTLSIAVSITSIASSQSKSDSMWFSALKSNQVETYISKLNTQSPIYNGRMYSPYLKLNSGNHPFYLDDQYYPGSVHYGDYSYKDLKLKYDIVREQLIVAHPNHHEGLILDPEFVRGFTLTKRKFVYVNDSIANRFKLPIGYYEVLHDGNLTLLARRQKRVVEAIVSSEVSRTVAEESRYYLSSGSGYATIKSKKNLLQLLKSTQFQNKEFIKNQSLNYKTSREKMIRELVKFHDSISH